LFILEDLKKKFKSYSHNIVGIFVKFVTTDSFVACEQQRRDIEFNDITVQKVYVQLMGMFILLQVIWAWTVQLMQVYRL